MKRLVADTGPLLHLHEAGALHLLPLVGAVHVPEAVFNEARTFAASLPGGGVPSWLTLHALSPAAQERAQQWQQASLLDAGEAAAVSLALTRNPQDNAQRAVNFKSHGVSEETGGGIVGEQPVGFQFQGQADGCGLARIEQ